MKLKQAYELLSKKPLYQGFFSYWKYSLKHTRYTGEWTEPFHREIFERGDAIAALLHDPVKDVFVLIEQFRPGAIEKREYPWLTETVAGMIEIGESPEEVVRREVKEETGCEVSDLEFITRYFVSPGGTTEELMLYYARVDSQQAAAFAGLAEEQEDIRVMLVPVDEALARLKAGEYQVATLIIALQWFALRQQGF
jgi:ADP-ribose pyrophosphatase